MRYAIALIAATVGISFSDWLFFGVIFHDRYMKTPELWRPTPESKKIAGSMAVSVIGTAAFFVLADVFGAHSLSRSMILAVLVWAAASLPQTVTNTLYLKYAPELGFSQTIGWLARFVLAAAAYSFIVG
jgi:Protein of unknown function (DUF1761)